MILPPTPLPCTKKSLPSSAVPQISTKGVAVFPLLITGISAAPPLATVPLNSDPVMLPPSIGVTVQMVSLAISDMNTNWTNTYQV